MSLSTYSLDELREIILRHIRGRVTGANIASGSDYHRIATAIATAAHGSQAAAQHIVEQVLPSTSDAKWLDRHAALRGIERQPAAKARGKILVLGTVNTSIVEGLTLTHADSEQAYVTITQDHLTIRDWEAFSGQKTVAPGSSRSRLILNPHATDTNNPPQVGDVISVDGFRSDAVKALEPPTGTPFAFDLYYPLDSVPASGTNVDPATGAIITVEASAPGAAGNLTPGEELVFDEAPAGVSGNPVVLEMTGGGELETLDEWRARIMDWLAERPGGGNRADHHHRARETPDVRLSNAFVYPAYRGLGSVDVVPFGVSGSRRTGEAANALIQAHLDSFASFQDDVLVRELWDGVDVDLTVTAEVEPGYEPDFDGALTTHATQADLDKVQLTAVTIPDEIFIGARVLVQAGLVGPRLYQRKVVGIESGPVKLVLDEALPALPSATASLYAGGPNSQAIIDAVTALFEDLGPGDTDPPSRFPAPNDAHPDELSHAQQTAAVMAVDGVHDVSIADFDYQPPTLRRLRLGQLVLELTPA